LDFYCVHVNSSLNIICCIVVDFLFTFLLGFAVPNKLAIAVIDGILLATISGGVVLDDETFVVFLLHEITSLFDFDIW
jgi:hypothetical protein